MAETTNKAKWTALTKPFSDDEIELLPKPLKKDAPKGKCAECGGYHGMPAVHLSYVGHAGLTMRLNEVVGPEGWDLEPMGFTPEGTPAMSDGGMWARLTILGVTKVCFGDAQGKTGPNATKEIIGDALRNGAMRFGIGTYLWGKSDKAKAELTRMGMDDTTPRGEDGQDWKDKGTPIGSDAPIVKAIYGKKKALGLSDADLKLALAAHYGKEHVGDLTMAEAKDCADRLQQKLDAKAAEGDPPWPDAA